MRRSDRGTEARTKLPPSTLSEFDARHEKRLAVAYGTEVLMGVGVEQRRHYFGTKLPNNLFEMIGIKFFKKGLRLPVLKCK